MQNLVILFKFWVWGYAIIWYLAATTSAIHRPHSYRTPIDQVALNHVSQAPLTFANNYYDAEHVGKKSITQVPNSYRSIHSAKDQSPKLEKKTYHRDKYANIFPDDNKQYQHLNQPALIEAGRAISSNSGPALVNYFRDLIRLYHEGVAYNYGKNIKNNIYLGRRHPLTWLYQSYIIIGVLVIMYGLEVVIDFCSTGEFNYEATAATCIMLGANFRDSGNTIKTQTARFLTCALLHADVLHLFWNSISIVWSFIYLFAGIQGEHCWVFYWTFPIFMITAFFGSLFSYFTTLRNSSFSIGASGGCLGLATSFLVLSVYLEGIPSFKRKSLIGSIVSIIGSCFPWHFLNRLLWPGDQTIDNIDYGAHFAGGLTGVGLSFMLLGIVRQIGTLASSRVGDVLSISLLVLLILAYIKITVEYRVEGKELLARLHKQWYGDNKSMGGESNEYEDIEVRKPQ